MQRKSFALLWGRKIFFGLSFPLSCLLGLLYLKGSSLPIDFSEWFYFVTNLVGYYGFLNILFFYLLFYPIARVQPSYYVVRIWSLLLILILNSLIVIDAMIFSKYQVHLYSDIGKLLLSGDLHHLASNGIFAGIIASFLVYALVVWLRGEATWRSMQGRFYNPIGGIHLGVIFFLLFVGKTFYFFSSVHPQFTAYFPFDLNYRNGADLEDGRKKFTYSKDLNCPGKENPNLIMITLKEWGSSDFTDEKMPHVYRMKRHGVSFSNHYSVASTVKAGLFTLFYSMPASYEPYVGNVKPFFLKEMNKRKYEILDYGRNEEDSWVSFKSWSNNRGEETKPFFLSIVLDGIVQESDVLIQEMISILQERNLLENTHIVITGSHPGKISNSRIPLLYIDSKRRTSEGHHPTSHYDVLPSMTQNLWNCKNSFDVAGAGFPLTQQKREWLFSSTPNSFKIYDFLNDGMIEVIDGKIKTSGNARGELVLSTIEQLKRYY